MINKVEVGKKYRLIDKQGYVSCKLNGSLNKHLVAEGCFDSDLCVVIDEVDNGGWGKSSGNFVISTNEYRFFELVTDESPTEEISKEITPETEVTITTTYGELARVYCVIGRVNGITPNKNLFAIAGNLLGDEDRSAYRKIHSITNTLPNLINYNSIQKEWESLFFKSKEQQEKEMAIKEKRAVIAKLEKEIKELEGE